MKSLKQQALELLKQLNKADLKVLIRELGHNVPETPISLKIGAKI